MEMWVKPKQSRSREARKLEDENYPVDVSQKRSKTRVPLTFTYSPSQLQNISDTICRNVERLTKNVRTRSRIFQNLTHQRKKTRYSLCLNIHKIWYSLNKCLVSGELRKLHKKCWKSSFPPCSLLPLTQLLLHFLIDAQAFHIHRFKTAFSTTGVQPEAETCPPVAHSL